MARWIARVVVLGAVSLVAWGCDDGDDLDDHPDGEEFVGDYQVTSHRENHQQGEPVPCSDPGAEVEADDPGAAPYFALRVDHFFDDLLFQACSGPGTGCSDTILRLVVSEGAVESTSSNTQTGGGSCNLYADHAQLSFDGPVATLENRQWSAFDQPTSDCTLEAAEALIGTADCQDVVVWVGTRL